MFKQRVLTALVLVPLVLMAIYFATTGVLAGLVALLMVLLGWEWLQLIPLERPVYRMSFIAALLLLIVPAVYWLDAWLWVDLVCWGAILGAVLTFPMSEKMWGKRAIVCGAGLLLLPVVASALSALYQQPQGRDLVVYLLCLIWAADIGAYLAGKQWGLTKLIPAVSPGKTVQGTMGGCALAILVAGLGAVYFKPLSMMVWFVVAISTALMSMLGDLFISMLKRRCHLKDTGRIFPGHGGVLDRLDSFIAALPLFYFLYGFLIR